jgi:hypothetical protein
VSVQDAVAHTAQLMGDLGFGMVEADDVDRRTFFGR